MQACNYLGTIMELIMANMILVVIRAVPGGPWMSTKGRMARLGSSMLA